MHNVLQMAEGTRQETEDGCSLPIPERRRKLQLEIRVPVQVPARGGGYGNQEEGALLLSRQARGETPRHIRLSDLG